MPTMDDVIAALRGGGQQDAMPFGTGTPQEPEVAAPAMIGNMAQAAVDIPKHMIDAAHNVDPTTPYSQQPEAANAMIGANTEAALALAGGGMGAAEEGAAGALGGRLAKTANHPALLKAERFESMGANPADIMNETGWVRHPLDQQWRFEIPDNNSKVNYFDPTVKTTADAGFMFSNPNVYDAYPILKNRIVTFSKNPTKEGMFYPDNGAIEAAAPTRGDLRGIMAHEQQHAIQQIEGFGPGGNSDEIARFLSQQLHKSGQSFNYSKIQDDAYAAYRKMAGEVEARNVDYRKDMTPEQRQANPFWKTQEYPFEQQLYTNPSTGNFELNPLIHALKNK